MLDLNSVQGFLFDLDGVFYVGDQLIEGGPDVLAGLRQKAIPYRFITNTTTRSRRQLQQKLQGLGIDVDSSDLLTAPAVTRRYLLNENLMRCYLAISPEVEEDFKGIQQVEGSPQAVVVGDIGDAWSYALIDRLFNYLVAGARLIAMHRNRFWQKATGLHVDIGAFVAGLEYAAGVEAEITGKPTPAFFRLAADELGLSCSRVAVIGDDVESDVGGAQAAGMSGILVKTGKYRPELVAKSGVEPDLVVDSIASLAGYLGL